MAQRIFDTVAIVGPGLVGGSVGMGLRRRGLAQRVIGIGRRQASLDEALEVGAVDETSLDVGKGVQEADLVVLATPLGTFEALIEPIAASMKRGALLTDVASAKEAVVRTLTAGLKGRPDIICIPTHPMAGGERRGARSAQENLFEGSVCIFVPLPDTPPAPLARLESLWRALGAEMHTMSPEAHDRLVARISHLPHLAAAALMQVVGEEEAAFAGGGLLDTTRTASGDASLWRDICAANSAEIGAALESLVSQLEEIRELLEEENFDTLERLLSDSKARRDRLAARRGARNPTDADQ